MYSKFYLKKDIVKIFGKSCLIVVTGSMEPTIHIKELIVIKEQNKYEVNDIVTYNKKNNFVTHRIVEINGEEIITRGDNNTVNDEPIKMTNIEGKVIFHSIVLGELFLYWSKPIVILIFLVSMFNFIKYNLVLRKVKINDENS